MSTTKIVETLKRRNLTKDELKQLVNELNDLMSDSDEDGEYDSTVSEGETYTDTVEEKITVEEQLAINALQLAEVAVKNTQKELTTNKKLCDEFEQKVQLLKNEVFIGFKRYLNAKKEIYAVLSSVQSASTGGTVNDIDAIHLGRQNNFEQCIFMYVNNITNPQYHQNMEAYKKSSNQNMQNIFNSISNYGDLYKHINYQSWANSEGLINTFHSENQVELYKMFVKEYILSYVQSKYNLGTLIQSYNEAKKKLELYLSNIKEQTNYLNSTVVIYETRKTELAELRKKSKSV